MHNDALIEAAKQGDVTKVRQLLREAPAAAAAAAPSGETPIMAALYRGHKAVADEIANAVEAGGDTLDIFAAAALGRSAALDASLTKGAPLETYAYDGWTPLHLAAFFGQLDAARRLLEHGAPLNAVSRNSLTNTPLHAAVAGGHVDLALMLIAAGADVNAKDAGGHTPLHIAAEAGLVPIARALITKGADPHAVDAEEKTPLSRAAARNHPEIVDLITVKGNDGPES